VRAARRQIAESNVRVAGIGTELTLRDVRIRVKSAFYDVLQRQAVLELAEADRNLLKDHTRACEAACRCGRVTQI